MRKIVTAAATLAFTAATAQAATVYTPPLAAEMGGQLRCSVTNVSGQNREVTISIIDSLGNVIAQSGPSILGPGRVRRIDDSGSDRRYCRVAVKGGKNAIRVSAESRLGGDTIAAVNGF